MAGSGSHCVSWNAIRASVSCALKTAGRSDLIDSRLSAGTVTVAAEVQEVPNEPIVQVSAVSTPPTRSVNRRAELLLTWTVRLTASLEAVSATSGESIETLPSLALASEVPEGEPKVTSWVKVWGMAFIRASIATLHAEL